MKLTGQEMTRLMTQPSNLIIEVIVANTECLLHIRHFAKHFTCFIGFIKQILLLSPFKLRELSHRELK